MKATMSALKEHVIVGCPLYYLIYHVERYFTVHRRGRTPGTFTLTLDVAKIGLPGKVHAQHDVRVQHAIRTDTQHGQVVALTWDPDDRYVPGFDGKLFGEPLEHGGSRLVLAGTYNVPMGPLGVVFDAVLGKRITAATAGALLQDLKQFVESDYAIARTTSLASSPKE